MPFPFFIPFFSSSLPLLHSFPSSALSMLGLKKGINSAVSKVTKKFKTDKSKEEVKQKIAPPSGSGSHSHDRVTTQKKKSDPSSDDKTIHDGDATTNKKNPKTSQSPVVSSPANASPAGSCEDSKGEHDKSEEGVTAKSIKGVEHKVTEHFGQFLDNIAAKGWQKVAEEFKTGFKTNAEVNRTTRYVIKFNVPPDGDFYDANHVDFANVDPKFIVAAVPDGSVTNKETFWRMIYDACPSLVMFVENYEAETKETKNKIFVPWKAGEARDYGKINVNNKKVTTDSMMNAVLEVLPEGCSNSIITRFVQVLKWPETVLGDPDGSVQTAAVQAVRLIKEEKGPVLVVCNNGCGRSAMYVMAHIILTRLNAQLKVSMNEVLRMVRSDRWGAIQTVEQYLTLHMLLLDYIITKYPRLKDQCSAMKKSLIGYVEKTSTKKK